MAYKLNTKEAQEAWEDYREFLVGLQPVAHKHAVANNPTEKARDDARMRVQQDAFKHGFAAGAAASSLNHMDGWPTILKADDAFEQNPHWAREISKPKEMVAATVDAEPIKQPLKRKKTKYRNYREPSQAKKETNEVVDLLQRKLFPTKLMHIIQYMRENGHNHWNNKNASGFLVSAIKNGAPIKKVSLGVYEYDPTKENR